MHPHRLIDKSIPKEETHDEKRQKSGQNEQYKKTDGRSDTFLEQLPQAGQHERTEGVKGADRAFGFGHGGKVIKTGLQKQGKATSVSQNRRPQPASTNHNRVGIKLFDGSRKPNARPFNANGRRIHQEIDNEKPMSSNGQVDQCPSKIITSFEHPPEPFETARVK